MTVVGCVGVTVVGAFVVAIVFVADVEAIVGAGGVASFAAVAIAVGNFVAILCFFGNFVAIVIVAGSFIVVVFVVVGI